MLENNKQNIFIIPATKRDATNFLRKNHTEKFDFWIYLGRHATRCADIERIIGDNITKKDIGEELQRVARIHRQNYVNFIGNLVKSENNILWYLTSLSEKNPYVSNFFLNFCYMQALIMILSDSQEKICIFCENCALAKSIKKNIEKNYDLNVVLYRNLYSKTLDDNILRISLIKNKSWFIIRFFLRIFYAKIVRWMKKLHDLNLNKQPLILIRSWLDQRSFSNSDYHDIFFGDLNRQLQDNNLNVIQIIDILPTIWYPLAVKKMKKSNIQWCLLEEFLDFSDILYSLIKVYQNKKWISSNFFLSDLDVSDIVYDEKAKDYANSRAEQSYLNYRAGKKICQSFVFNSMIYTFENHNWEKMMIEGIRKINPKSNLVGYAHSTVNLMDTVYSLSSVEKHIAPLPNKILVNGILAKRKLSEYGFDFIPTEIIGAVRFQDLKVNIQKKDSNQEKTILVILSVNFDGTVEMILKCTEAFKNIENIRVILKPHPAHKASNFSQYTKNFPSYFFLSYDPIHELFERTDLVIFTDSTASVEAAVRGIPLLHIKSDFTIDINIFDGVSMVQSVNSPEKIRLIAMKYLSSNELSSVSIKEVIEELFAPVDEGKILSII